MATYSENLPDLEKVPLSALTVKNLDRPLPAPARPKKSVHAHFFSAERGLWTSPYAASVRRCCIPPPFLIRAAVDNAGLRRELIYLGI
jgi:hypothetical protein